VSKKQKKLLEMVRVLLCCCQVGAGVPACEAPLQRWCQLHAQAALDANHMYVIMKKQVGLGKPLPPGQNFGQSHSWHSLIG
jgi:hypothetical protein